MSYKSTRRQWVKLWVNEWLDGTTRFKLTRMQRLLWIDLLALAGRSRWPGKVFAGYGENEKPIGYPLSWLAGTLGFEVTDLNNALVILEAQGHITLELHDDSAIIGVINWEKYQSEYLRQRGYRKVTTKRTSRLPVEEEGDVEGEREVEDSATSAFTAIGFDKPFGQPQFQSVWLRNYARRGERWLTEVMEETIQECQRKKINAPPQFFAAKRDIEQIENGKLNQRVPL